MLWKTFLIRVDVISVALGTSTQQGNLAEKWAFPYWSTSSSCVPGTLFWLCLLPKRHLLPISSRALKVHLWSQWHTACDRSALACGWKSQGHWRLQGWPLLELHMEMINHTWGQLQPAHNAAYVKPSQTTTDTSKLITAWTSLCSLEKTPKNLFAAWGGREKKEKKL